ncbi:hypothetical protein M758_12G025000 [Ceratodon purpureus]|nr:hypothetical protein M758_12G025000 [Ceratodon purpureus]
MAQNLGRAGRSVGSFVGRLWRQGMRRTESSLCDHAAQRGAVANEGLHELQRFAPSFRGSQFLPRNLGLQKPGLDRRLYYTDSRGVVHFKKRGPVVWFEQAQGGGRSGQKKILIILGVAGCGSAYIYYNNLETVPYTHRKHFVLIGPSMERQLGEQEFNNLKAQMSAKILPPIHPQAVRVRRIARDVIEAAMAGTKTQSWGQVEHPSHVPHPSFSDSSAPVTRGTSLDDKLHKSHEDMYGNDKLEDDMWVDKSRKKGLDEGAEGFTAHLNNLKWEVIVVDEDVMNAFCLPGGKIVVFTGLLKQFRSDPEVATVLGHEVGHVVARHVAEKLTQGIWLGFVQLVILSFIYVPGLVSSTADLLLRLPFSRRMESEADHIGLMLMAAAGYDPRLAPGFYEKMGQIGQQPEMLQYVTTHPSGKKRAEALRNSATMQEALGIYSERIAGQGQHGFL